MAVRRSKQRSGRLPGSQALALMAFALLLGGCASFWESLGSKNAVAGCQVADVASTHYALHHNPGASEQNPMPVPALDVIKIALAAYIKWGIDDDTWTAMWLPARIFVTSLGCGAAINNLHVARERP